MIRIARRLVPWILLIALPACGTDTGLGPGPSGTGDDQTPRAGEQVLEAWLATGAYQR